MTAVVQSWLDHHTLAREIPVAVLSPHLSLPSLAAFSLSPLIPRLPPSLGSCLSPNCWGAHWHPWTSPRVRGTLGPQWPSFTLGTCLGRHPCRWPPPTLGTTVPPLLPVTPLCFLFFINLVDGARSALHRWGWQIPRLSSSGTLVFPFRGFLSGSPGPQASTDGSVEEEVRVAP